MYSRTLQYLNYATFLTFPDLGKLQSEAEREPPVADDILSFLAQPAYGFSPADEFVSLATKFTLLGNIVRDPWVDEKIGKHVDLEKIKAFWTAVTSNSEDHSALLSDNMKSRMPTLRERCGRLVTACNQYIISARLQSADLEVFRTPGLYARFRDFILSPAYAIQMAMRLSISGNSVDTGAFLLATYNKLELLALYGDPNDHKAAKKDMDRFCDLPSSTDIEQMNPTARSQLNAVSDRERFRSQLQLIVHPPPQAVTSLKNPVNQLFSPKASVPMLSLREMFDQLLNPKPDPRIRLIKAEVPLFDTLVGLPRFSCRILAILTLP